MYALLIKFTLKIYVKWVLLRQIYYLLVDTLFKVNKIPVSFVSFINTIQKFLISVLARPPILKFNVARKKIYIMLFLNSNFNFSDKEENSDLSSDDSDGEVESTPYSIMDKMVEASLTRDPPSGKMGDWEKYTKVK